VLAPRDAELVSQANGLPSEDVPAWHFSMVRDDRERLGEIDGFDLSPLSCRRCGRYRLATNAHDWNQFSIWYDPTDDAIRRLSHVNL
jgi:hypothetical protein